WRRPRWRSCTTGARTGCSPPTSSSGPRWCSTSPRCRRTCSRRCSPVPGWPAGAPTSWSRSGWAGWCGPPPGTSGPAPAGRSRCRAGTASRTGEPRPRPLRFGCGAQAGGGRRPRAGGLLPGLLPPVGAGAPGRRLGPQPAGRHRGGGVRGRGRPGRADGGVGAPRTGPGGRGTGHGGRRAAGGPDVVPDRALTHTAAGRVAAGRRVRMGREEHPDQRGRSVVADPTSIRIPDDLRPADGRFGSGPAKIRPEAVEALRAVASSYLGTSHRQRPVRDQVARLRRGVAELFDLPDGYEVVLGNGGTTAFWEVAAFGLVRDRAQCASFGEFGAKFAKVLQAAPFLSQPSLRSAEPGHAASLVAEEGVD